MFYKFPDREKDRSEPVNWTGFENPTNLKVFYSS